MAPTLVTPTNSELPKEGEAKTAAGPDDAVMESWQPVRSKKSKLPSRAKSLDNKQGGLSVNSLKSTISTKDELTFLMDEDLSDQQLSLAGRKKAYTDHDDFDDELDDYEISDHDLRYWKCIPFTFSVKSNEVYF